MPKTLKIWNGRGWGSRSYDKDGNKVLDETGREYCDHVFVCAHSVAELIKICGEAINSEREYFYNPLTRNEINTYWSKNCWGNSMKDVCDEDNPEVGVWTQQGHDDTPKRIYPIEITEEKTKNAKKETKDVTSKSK